MVPQANLPPARGARISRGDAPAEEVWPAAPAGLTVENVYFELVPAEWITEVITVDGKGLAEHP